MSPAMWLITALGIGFIVYLLYTCQFRWLLGVLRNMALGVAGFLLFNMFFADMGVSVGINAVTALIVGLLGAPGFLMLYAASMLL